MHEGRNTCYHHPRRVVLNIKAAAVDAKSDRCRPGNGGAVLGEDESGVLYVCNHLWGNSDRDAQFATLGWPVHRRWRHRARSTQEELEMRQRCNCIVAELRQL